MLLLFPAAARAEWSELEQRTVVRALRSGDELESNPDGLRIERIDVVTLEVFDEEDPVPDFLNALHTTTREHVIRRELLFSEGQAFSTERVEETERNLRLILQLGVVVIAPLRGSRPGTVRVLVVTRDVWSLRPNLDIRATRFTPDGISYLLVNLSEDNWFGEHTRVGALFTLNPDRYSLGATFSQARIAGSRVYGLASGSVYQNRHDGTNEGSYGALRFGQELYSVDARWGFGVGGAWLSEVTRLYRGVEIDRYDAASTPGDDAIPIAYDTRIVRGGAEVVRSFGRANKLNVKFGVELNRRRFHAERPNGVEPSAFEEFVADELPVSDTRLSPFVELDAKTTRYFTTRDLETLALAESYRLGPRAALRLYPASSHLGSSRDLFGVISWLGYTVRLGDGMARAVLGSTAEYEPSLRGELTFQGALRVATPRLGFGRLIHDVAVVDAARNYLNRKLSLGGQNRPRGYAAGEFRGGSGAASTLEFRSSAVNILSARVGLAAFYDAGGTSERLEHLNLRHSAGAGLRVLFPQANRYVFRVDWGAPLSPGYSSLPGGVFITFLQAFEPPDVLLPDLLGSETTLLPQPK